MTAGPNAIAELPSMLARAGQERDRGRRAAPDRVQPGDARHGPPVRGDAVAQRPPHPLPGDAPRAGRPRIDRRDRSRVRHVRLHAPRRRGRHERLSGVQRDRRRRRLALGRGDRRHDRPGGRRLGRQGRPRRYGPDRCQAAVRDPHEHPRQPVRPRPDRRSTGPCRPPAGAAWSAPTAGSPRPTSARSTARSAACACSAADRRAAHSDAHLRLPLRQRGTASRSFTASTTPVPRAARCAAARTVRKAFTAPTIHFKGSGWAKKDRGASARKASASTDRTVGPRRLRGRVRRAASTARRRRIGRIRDGSRTPGSSARPRSSGSGTKDSSGSSLVLGHSGEPG